MLAKRLILSSVLVFTAAPSVQAQTASGARLEAQDEGDADQEPKKKKKRHKKRKKARADGDEKKRAGDEDEAGADSGSEREEPAAPPAPKSRFFPPWPTNDWSWHLAPIIAYSTGVYGGSDSSTVRTSTVETGLRGSINDIPLVPGNPGLGIGVHGGEAFGANDTLVTDGEGVEKTSHVRFTRSFAGFGLRLYYSFVRQELDVTRGRIQYMDDSKTQVQSLDVVHDLGILILPWLSGHYTLSWLRAFGSSYDEALLQQTDHWLHARMAFSLLDFHLDIGPGHTEIQEFGHASGSTDDVRLATALNIIWKLGASGEAKYVYDASTKELGSLANTRLPEQELQRPTAVGLPADSFVGSYFLGIHNLAYGFGIGWRYNLEILNLGRRGGAERVTTKNQGLGVDFSLAI